MMKALLSLRMLLVLILAPLVETRLYTTEDTNVSLDLNTSQ